MLIFRRFTPPTFKALKFIICSNLYINSRTNFKTIRYLWLTIQEKISPRVAIFLKKITKFSHFHGFCHRNMGLRLTKMAKKYTFTPLVFYNNHFESKNKQYACCSSLFNVYTHFSLKLSAMLAAILDFSDRTMIQANHPRFSCTTNMSLTIYGIIFSGPLMHTDTFSGTVLLKHIQIFP